MCGGESWRKFVNKTAGASTLRWDTPFLLSTSQQMTLNQMWFVEGIRLCGSFWLSMASKCSIHTYIHTYYFMVYFIAEINQITICTLIKEGKI
jgi:hypothetical protein